MSHGFSVGEAASCVQSGLLGRRIGVLQKLVRCGRQNQLSASISELHAAETPVFGDSAKLGVHRIAFDVADDCAFVQFIRPN